MEERTRISLTRKGLRIGIILSIIMGIIGVVCFKSLVSAILCPVVGIYLWINGFVLVSVFIENDNVNFVLLNKKSSRYLISDIERIDNYWNYIFVVRTKDEKCFIAMDSLNTRLLVYVDGKSHVGINETDFPGVEYHLH